MKLNELRDLLDNNRDKQFLLQLPDQNHVPVSFHITEVGQVDKKFIDCGGKIHFCQTCQIQAWVGEDSDHRLNAGKLADILRIARKVVTNDQLELEVEYEDKLISQYTVSESVVTIDAVILQLASKHTDCLAKEICNLPTASGSSCCGTTGCC